MLYPQFRGSVKFLVVFSLLLGIAVDTALSQQKMDGIARQQANSMLKNVKNAIIDNYYDPNFGGMDVEARFKKAEEKLKTADTLSQAFAIIAQAVTDLNDSHTRFYPPSRNSIVEYGWRNKVIGDKVFISAIKEKSDAEKKGLRIGDEVVAINGFPPTRSDMWKMNYFYRVLSPQQKMSIEVRSPDGTTKQLSIESKVKTQQRIVNLNNSQDFNEGVREGEKMRDVYKHHFKEISNTIIWKMPNFAFDPAEVDSLIGRANGKSTLILDLRGNGGGYVVTLERLVGYFFDRDIKIADLKGRKPMDPQLAKTRGSKFFAGKVVVLIDADSGSAAEIFARLMQIEKRGVVLGDVSAGAVMQSRGVSFDAGVATSIGYGMNLTNADVIMTDGKSLEHVGVKPDELILLTGKEMSERSDPVLARALEISGNKMDAATAGKLFPVEPFIERTTNLAITLEW